MSQSIYRKDGTLEQDKYMYSWDFYSSGIHLEFQKLTPYALHLFLIDDPKNIGQYFHYLEKT